MFRLRESATNKSASTATGRRERTFGIDNQIPTFRSCEKRFRKDGEAYRKNGDLSFQQVIGRIGPNGTYTTYKPRDGYLFLFAGVAFAFALPEETLNWFLTLFTPSTALATASARAF